MYVRRKRASPQTGQHQNRLEQPSQWRAKADFELYSIRLQNRVKPTVRPLLPPACGGPPNPLGRSSGGEIGRHPPFPAAKCADLRNTTKTAASTRGHGGQNAARWGTPKGTRPRLFLFEQFHQLQWARDDVE
jgi:hypothetical protein